MVPEILNAYQAAEYLGIGYSTLLKKLQAGELPGAKLGAGHWRIVKAELDNYLTARFRETQGVKRGAQDQ